LALEDGNGVLQGTVKLVTATLSSVKTKVLFEHVPVEVCETEVLPMYTRFWKLVAGSPQSAV
jgi:hypothetical protein